MVGGEVRVMAHHALAAEREHPSRQLPFRLLYRGHHCLGSQ